MRNFDDFENDFNATRRLAKIWVGFCMLLALTGLVGIGYAVFWALSIAEKAVS